jgi:hypothetical protein
MDISAEVTLMIGRDEDDKLEYSAVLMPSRNIAVLISSFANAEGGYIILGINYRGKGKMEVIGLSEDFHANSVTHKALDLIVPQISVSFQYITYQGKKLFVIKVPKTKHGPIAVEGRIYKRNKDRDELINAQSVQFQKNGYDRVKLIYANLQNNKRNATNAHIRLLEHYQSILKIMDDLGMILYPDSPTTPANNQEGKVLSRILFSSYVDNFETYLSDLLYEIYLAQPSTLKSRQQVSIEEVLNCTDLEDFVKYIAKQKIGKLQRGSVRGFISDNRQISDLEVLDEKSQNEIEKILQIRHLYSHRNGIIDEKFLQFFAGKFSLNEEHRMAVAEICDKLCFLSEVVNIIDGEAVRKYNLGISK